jgi:hypothetical protein
MTETVEALNEFKVVPKPEDLHREGMYIKIARAVKVLGNESSLEIPMNMFKCKNFAASIQSAARRIGVKVGTCRKNGVVYVFKRS